MKKLLNQNKFLIVVLLCCKMNSGFAQTDIDAIMMEKNAFCVGPMYSYSSWKNYWEGTLKRDNLNNGTISTQMNKFFTDNRLRRCNSLPTPFLYLGFLK